MDARRARRRRRHRAHRRPSPAETSSPSTKRRARPRGLQPGLVDLATFNIAQRSARRRFRGHAASRPSATGCSCTSRPIRRTLAVLRGGELILFRNRPDGGGRLADFVHQTAMYLRGSPRRTRSGARLRGAARPRRASRGGIRRAVPFATQRAAATQVAEVDPRSACRFRRSDFAARPNCCAPSRRRSARCCASRGVTDAAARTSPPARSTTSGSCTRASGVGAALVVARDRRQRDRLHLALADVSGGTASAARARAAARRPHGAGGRFAAASIRRRSNGSPRRRSKPTASSTRGPSHGPRSSTTSKRRCRPRDADVGDAGQPVTKEGIARQFVVRGRTSRPSTRSSSASRKPAASATSCALAEQVTEEGLFETTIEGRLHAGGHRAGPAAAPAPRPSAGAHVDRRRAMIDWRAPAREALAGRCRWRSPPFVNVGVYVLVVYPLTARTASVEARAQAATRDRWPAAATSSAPRKPRDRARARRRAAHALLR